MAEKSKEEEKSGGNPVFNVIKGVGSSFDKTMTKQEEAALQELGVFGSALGGVLGTWDSVNEKAIPKITELLTARLLTQASEAQAILDACVKLGLNPAAIRHAVDEQTERMAAAKNGLGAPYPVGSLEQISFGLGPGEGMLSVDLDYFTDKEVQKQVLDAVDPFQELIRLLDVHVVAALDAAGKENYLTDIAGDDAKSSLGKAADYLTNSKEVRNTQYLIIVRSLAERILQNPDYAYLSPRKYDVPNKAPETLTTAIYNSPTYSLVDQVVNKDIFANASLDLDVSVADPSVTAGATMHIDLDDWLVPNPTSREIAATPMLKAAREMLGIDPKTNEVVEDLIEVSPAILFFREGGIWDRLNKEGKIRFVPVNALNGIRGTPAEENYMNAVKHLVYETFKREILDTNDALEKYYRKDKEQEAKRNFVEMVSGKKYAKVPGYLEAVNELGVGPASAYLKLYEMWYKFDKDKNEYGKIKDIDKTEVKKADWDKFYENYRKVAKAIEDRRGTTPPPPPLSADFEDSLQSLMDLQQKRLAKYMDSLIKHDYKGEFNKAVSSIKGTQLRPPWIAKDSQYTSGIVDLTEVKNFLKLLYSDKNSVVPEPVYIPQVGGKSRKKDDMSDSIMRIIQYMGLEDHPEIVGKRADFKSNVESKVDDLVEKVAVSDNLTNTIPLDFQNITFDAAGNLTSFTPILTAPTLDYRDLSDSSKNLQLQLKNLKSTLAIVDPILDKMVGLISQNATALAAQGKRSKSYLGIKNMDYIEKLKEVIALFENSDRLDLVLQSISLLPFSISDQNKLKDDLASVLKQFKELLISFQRRKLLDATKNSIDTSKLEKLVDKVQGHADAKVENLSYPIAGASPEAIQRTLRMRDVISDIKAELMFQRVPVRNLRFDVNTVVRLNKLPNPSGRAPKDLKVMYEFVRFIEDKQKWQDSKEVVRTSPTHKSLLVQKYYSEMIDEFLEYLFEGTPSPTTTDRRQILAILKMYITAPPGSPNAATLRSKHTFSNLF